MPQRHVSTMHSISTLTVSRERQKPASSMVKPTCIPNTRNAAISVQTVLIGLTMSLPLRTGSAAKVFRPNNPGFWKRATSMRRAMAVSLPVSNTEPYRRHSGSLSRSRRRVTFCENDRFVISVFLPGIIFRLLCLRPFALQGRGASIAIADPDRLRYITDEDLAVTDFSGSSGGAKRLNDFIGPLG